MKGHVGKISTLLLLAVLYCHAASKDWCYTGCDTVVNNWATAYPICGGQAQSPVALESNGGRQSNLGKLVLTNYNMALNNLLVSNNGHTVQVTLPPGLTMSGGGLSGTYTALQLHFHWGTANGNGAEHTADGKIYPIEMHVVHILNTSDPTRDLAVLGMFLEVGAANSALQPIIDVLPNVLNSGTNANTTSAFNLDQLLPSSRTNFWRYNGGLTSPPCSEIVTWTVLQSTVSISNDQLNAIRKLQDSKHGLISGNYRPPQALNGRVVQRTFSGAGHLACQWASIAAALLGQLVATLTQRHP